MDNHSSREHGGWNQVCQVFCSLNFWKVHIIIKIVFKQYLKVIVLCIQIGSIGWTWKGVGDVVTITFQHLKVCRQIEVKRLQGIAETKLRAHLLQWNHRAMLWQYNSKLMVVLHVEGKQTFHFCQFNSSNLVLTIYLYPTSLFIDSTP